MQRMESVRELVAEAAVVTYTGSFDGAERFAFANHSASLTMTALRARRQS